MIYELALVVKTDLNEEEVKKLTELVHNVISEYEGEVLIEDEWGKLSLAQPTPKGTGTGHFFYFLYKASKSETNKELARRFKINEGVLRYMTVKLADNDKHLEDLTKNYKTPFSKKYNGSVTDNADEEGRDMEKDRKQFARRKTCWFTAKNLRADWKDPKTFAWLVNEFGKIAPARITGVSRKHQRFATTAIKRARNIGVISHLSNKLAQ